MIYDLVKGVSSIYWHARVDIKVFYNVTIFQVSYPVLYCQSKRKIPYSDIIILSYSLFSAFCSGLGVKKLNVKSAS